jgi:cytochrome c-type biogenesis protein CcmH
MWVAGLLMASAAALGGQASDQEGLHLSKGPLADPALEARAIKLSSRLQCPVCQGQSINDSPSPMAQQMKDLIRTQVSEGYTDEEVKAYFVSRYGEWVLLEPKAAGFNLLVYLLPALGLLAGVGLVVTAVRRWSAPAAGAGES